MPAGLSLVTRGILRVRESPPPLESHPLASKPSALCLELCFPPSLPPWPPLSPAKGSSLTPAPSAHSTHPEHGSEARYPSPQQDGLRMGGEAAHPAFVRQKKDTLPVPPA